MKLKLGILGLIAFVATVGPLATAAPAAPGDFDRSFGSSAGYSLNGAPLDSKTPSSIEYLRRLNDGSTIAMQRSDIERGGYWGRVQIAKRNADGTPDDSYGRGGFVTLPMIDGRRPDPRGLAIQGNSTIAVTAGDVNTEGTIYVQRLDNDTGTIDPAFGVKKGRTTLKLGSSDRQRAYFYTAGTEVDENGRIYIAGFSTNRTVIIRLNANGRPDQSFGNGGISEIETGKTPGFNSNTGFDSMEMTPDGIYLAYYGDYGTEPQKLLRIGFDGKPDPSFELDEMPDGETLVDMAKGPSGEIYILTRKGFYGRTIRKLNDDGGFDPAFDVGGQATVDITKSNWNTFAVDPAGRFLLGGVTDPGGPAVFRFTATGEPDPDFGTEGLARFTFASPGNASIHTAIVEGPGPPFFIGEILSDGYEDFLMQALDNGSLDQSFGDDGVSTVSAVAPPVDRIFDSVNARHGSTLVAGQSGVRAAFARYRANGRLDRSFGKGGWLKVLAGKGNQPAEAKHLAVTGDGDGIACVDTHPGVSVVRFSRKGLRDRSFGDSGVVEIDDLAFCLGVIPRRGGGIQVAGTTKRHDGVVVGLKANGKIDGSYGESGLADVPKSFGNFRNGLGAAVTGTRSGGALLASSSLMVKLNRLGRRDGRFGSDGVVRIQNKRNFHRPQPVAVSIVPGNGIFIGGRAGGRVQVRKFTGSGKPVHRFGRDGAVSKEVKNLLVVASDMKVQHDGRVVVTANGFENCDEVVDCRNELRVYRFTRRGRIDRSFGNKGNVRRRIGTNSEASTLTVTRRGLVVGGAAENSAGTYDFLLLRLRK